MSRCLRLSLSVFLVFFCSAATAAECVVLLHGLIRSASSMKPMAEALADAGFETANIEYPSRDEKIEELAPDAVEAGLEECRNKEGVETVHFVTHSLGGILVRYYLEDHDIPELGRVVMLGPPNRGSLAADRMRDIPGFDWVHGPAGSQLGKGPDSIPLMLGPADFEVGVIAGNRTIDPVTSVFLPDPDDGKVSVEDTHLDGMRDFVIVEHSHAFMMRMREPIELTIRFLRTGQFAADE